ncbi:MAG: YdcF family protein [Candidatus Nanopelagicaceae bacterium]
MFKLIRRFFTLIFLIIIGIPSFFFAQVWYEAHFPKLRSADYAVVMGAAQYDGRPSDALEARLVEAKRLYDSGLVKKIVTVGAGAPGDRYTEARAGRIWLIQNGVSRNNAIEIGKGRDTIQSVKAFTDYFKKNNINNIIIVTDPYHCKRSLFISDDLGINATCSPVKNGPFSLKNSSLHYLWREGNAYIAYRTLEKLGIHVSDHLESTGLSALGLG